VDYDVIIVGSGPAGCSTALHLAKRAPELARRTLILERERHPRHKLCGGGLVPDADVVLRNLDLDLTEVAHVDASWANFHYRGRGARIRLDDIAFRVVRRNELDAWLAGKTRERGVSIREDTRVDRLRPIEGGIEVETCRETIRARAIVGADGSKSVVRRMLFPELRNSGNVARLIEILTPDSPPGPQAQLPRDEAFFEFSCGERGVQGYVWSFPTSVDGRSMRNWGVFDSRALPQAPHGSLKEACSECLERYGYRLEDYQLEGHPLRWFDPGQAMSKPHVILAGDALGADAVLGEGISGALGFGDIAAAALVDGFVRDDLSFASYGHRVLASALGRALRRRTKGARLLYGIDGPLSRRLFWWCVGPAIRGYVKRYVFNWARDERG
jgi:flavin-dependent dehydrogenase